MPTHHSCPYAQPREVLGLDECYFYHSIDIPGYGLCEGEWDLREGVGAYLGHVGFGGRRVLELGTANGFLCFHMEKEGAEVVAYDLGPADSWDLVPYHHPQHDRNGISKIRSEHVRRINNGWWLAHRCFQSNARVVYGPAYDIPEAIGEVDIALFGSILLHLRDPFLAMERAARLARQSLIVTEIYPRVNWLTRIFLRTMSPAIQFLPDDRKLAPIDAWWVLTPSIVARFARILGFENIRCVNHTQLYNGRKVPMYTLVCER